VTIVKESEERGGLWIERGDWLIHRTPDVTLETEFHKAPHRVFITYG